MPEPGRELAGLRDRVEKAAAPFRRSSAPGALPQASASLAEAWAALAAVQAEKAGDLLAAGDEAGARASLAAADRLLAEREPAGPPDLVRHGRLSENAFFADNDGSPQPYVVFKPGLAASGNLLPCAILLHGYVPGTSRTRPWILAQERFLDTAERLGALVVLPHGRTNTDFQFAGERDVLRVVAEVQRFHRADPERTGLLGVSMGGAGVWQLGMHHPDLVSGLAPINAQADWFLFWEEQYGWPARADLPRHMEWLVSLHNPPDLCRNLGPVPVLCQHATRCFLGVEKTRRLVEAVRAWGTPCGFREDPSPRGHYSYLEPGNVTAALQFLAARRRPPAPDRVRWVTRTLRHPGAWWLRVTGLEAWGPAAEVDAGFKDGRLSIASVNAAGLEIRPPARFLQDGRLPVLEWNGDVRRDLAPDTRGVIDLAASGNAAGSRFRKDAATCGPAADVLNFPFVVARGTAGTPEETRANERLAAAFAADWQAYAEGRASVIRDADLTPQLVRDQGLVLVGLPETNSYLGRVARQLPLLLSRERIALPDGRAFPAAGTGLVLCHPNPENPSRYVLVLSGLPWGQGRTANHRFDLLPDYAVFTAEILPGTGANRFLAAGFFDVGWNFRPELADFAAGSIGPRRD